MMILSQSYKPATSYAAFIELFPHTKPDPNVPSYVTWRKNYANASESTKIEILKYLSATSSEKELKEYQKVPAEWLNIMFEDIAKWGINGEIIETFFQNLIQTAINDPDKLLAILDKTAFEQRTDRKKFSRSMSHLFASINTSRFFQPKGSGTAHRNGLRYKFTRNFMTEDLIRSRSNGTDLIKHLHAEDYQLIANVVTTLSCIDRVGAKGSPYTQEDYDLFINHWKELIASEIKTKVAIQ